MTPQNDNSEISAKLFQYFTGIVIILQQKTGIIVIPVFQWNNHNKKILESSNLLGPIVWQ